MRYPASQSHHGSSKLINGKTRLIAHLGYPTETFTAPKIYNPWFEARGVDAVVMPMGVRAEDFADAISMLRRVTNFHGALVTMPHKVNALEVLDEISVMARIAGSCNAIRLGDDGELIGDQFDGEGFVRGMRSRGREPAGSTALIIGAGGVGSAIAASLAGAGAAHLSLFDIDGARAAALAERLASHYPALDVTTGVNEPAGHQVVVNATPLGMKPADVLPLEPARLDPDCFVGEVVLGQRVTPLLQAAQARGCQTQAGTAMLFEMIPAYLEFFGFGEATADELRAAAMLS